MKENNTIQEQRKEFWISAGYLMCNVHINENGEEEILPDDVGADADGIFATLDEDSLSDKNKYYLLEALNNYSILKAKADKSEQWFNAFQQANDDWSQLLQKSSDLKNENDHLKAKVEYLLQALEGLVNKYNDKNVQLLTPIAYFKAFQMAEAAIQKAKQ
jgi:hypothetical protein